MFGCCVKLVSLWLASLFCATYCCIDHNNNNVASTKTVPPENSARNLHNTICISMVAHVFVDLRVASVIPNKVACLIHIYLVCRRVFLHVCHSSEVQFAILTLCTHCTQFSEKLTMRWWARLSQNSALIVKLSHTCRIFNVGRCRVQRNETI